MVIDKQEHQYFLLELLNAAQYPGHVLDLAYEVKQAIQNATFAEAQPAPTAQRPADNNVTPCAAAAE